MGAKCGPPGCRVTLEQQKHFFLHAYTIEADLRHWETNKYPLLLKESKEKLWTKHNKYSPFPGPVSLGTRGYPAPTSLRFLYLSCIRQHYCQSDEIVKPQLFHPHIVAGWSPSLLQRHHCKSFHPKSSQCITVRELYNTSYSQSLPPNLTIRTAWERAWASIK